MMVVHNNTYNKFIPFIYLHIHKFQACSDPTTIPRDIILWSQPVEHDWRFQHQYKVQS